MKLPLETQETGQQTRVASTRRQQSTKFQETERLDQGAAFQDAGGTFYNSKKSGHNTQISNVALNEDAISIREQVRMYKEANSRQDTVAMFNPTAQVVGGGSVAVGGNALDTFETQDRHIHYREKSFEKESQLVKDGIVQQVPQGLFVQHHRLLQTKQGVILNTQATNDGSQSKGDGTRSKPKKFPRKRYYNGIGKILLPPKESFNSRRDFTERHGKRTHKNSLLNPALYQAQVKEDQKSSRSYNRPYPGYAFNFGNLDHGVTDFGKQRPAGSEGLISSIHHFHKPHDHVPAQEPHEFEQQHDEIDDSWPLQDQMLSQVQQNSEQKPLFFTLDQYKWAQKQGFSNKPYLGHHSLGHKIEKEQAGLHSLNIGGRGLLPQEDFMLEEAAISHMIHKVDNLPKLKFQFLSDQDDQAASSTADKASTSMNTQKKTQSRNSVALNQGRKIWNDERLPNTIDQVLLNQNIEPPKTGFMSPEIYSPKVQGKQVRTIESTLAPREFHQSGIRQNKSQQVGQRPLRNRYFGTVDRVVAQKSSMENNKSLAKIKSNASPDTRSSRPTREPQRSVEEPKTRKDRSQLSRISPTLSQGKEDKFDSISPSVMFQEPNTYSKMHIDESTDNRALDYKAAYLRKMKYHYQVRPNEIEEEQIQLSPGNMYHEQTNPSIALFVNIVQSHIQQSMEQRQSMKDGVSKIFNMMKKTKNSYIKTLLEGEDLGHCKGIRKRMDPTTKYRLQQQMQKYKQIQEDRVEEIKALKKIKDQQKLEAKIERVQKRLVEIERQKSTIYLSPKSVVRSQSRGGEDSVLSQNMLYKFPSRDKIGRKQVKINLDIHNESMAQKSIDLKDETGHRRKESMSSDSLPGSPQPELKSRKAKALKNLKLKSPSKMSVSYHKSGTKTLSKTTTSHISTSQMAQKKLRQLRDLFSLKSLGQDSQKILENVLNPVNGANPSHNLLLKLIKIASGEDFVLFKQKSITGPGGGNIGQKQSHIFNNFKQIGLADNPNFQQFFISLCEEEVSLKYCRLKRQTFKEILQDRYSKQVGEKILAFVENQFQTLYRIDFHGFCNVVMEFLNSGPDFYKKMLFACLSLSNPGRICEHDLFNLLECFKQRDSYFFYKELINQHDVPRDFKEVVDDSDEIFFEAYAPDMKIISRAINLRKRILGIRDQDTNQDMDEDLCVNNFTSEEEYEEELVNQIDYMIGLIIRKTNTQYQPDVGYVLANSSSFMEMRNNLIRLIIRNKIVQRKDKKQESHNVSVMNESTQQQTVNFFKPPQTVNPCLGSGTVGRTGNQITQCSYLTYEDFNKLVVFKKGKVSSFVEDLVDHITNGVISVFMVEMHLGPFRELPLGQGFPANKLMNEYIAQKNLEMFGHSKGVPPINIRAKRNRQGQKMIVEKKKHEITTPFSIQDHYMAEEFGGKLLIRKVVSKKGIKRLNDGSVDQREGDKSMEGSTMMVGGEEDDQYGSDTQSQAGTQLKTNMILINEHKIHELIGYRHFLGDADFFRVFRTFYRLSNIPEDAQNNPFSLYMDKASILKGFSDVFGIDNEEIAIRFSILFIQPLSLPKEYKIDILRYFFVVKSICEERDKTGSNYLKLAFRFLDYDDNGNIGSVDILNLKKSLHVDQMDKIQNIFYQVALRKQLHRNMLKMKSKIDHKVITHQSKSRTSVDRIFLTLFSPEENAKFGQNPPAETSGDQNMDLSLPEINEEDIPAKQFSSGQQSPIEIPSSSGLSYQDSKKDERKEGDLDSSCVSKDKVRESPFESISLTESKVMTPFNKFLMEVQFLRDYFVKEVVMQKSKSSKEVLHHNQEFLTLKTYEKSFLALFEQKFGIESPTIIYFFRSKLRYQFEISKDLKNEKGNLYEGLYLPGFSKEEMLPVSQEMVEMQKILDQMSTPPRPQYFQAE